MVQRLKHLKSTILMIGGVVCLLIGIAFLPLPPPFFGMVFIAAGIPMLAAGSKRTRRFIQLMRWRHYRHNQKVEYLVSRLPSFLRKHGHRTRPDVLVRLRGKNNAKQG
ncbi:hypothetical protein [Thalassospira sp. GB04J01]|jgi:amino acid transporter|uniref:hypothetical protein n=1 Tax=Thalassospira TaxID=168934 RepID=UPI000C101358|nr:hypothetical protein [Thalassospira sp. GB04J01]MBV15980.1 hypothetical protein [Thalassospira sp.]|tara:strand:- start:110769 stop:111092 length:324 start_codon:yes stop_codon:yes gene_type:complete